MFFFPEISLPTRFTDRTGTLIDNFFCKVSEISLKSSPGILIDTFLDHQPKFNKQKHKKTPWITRSIIKSINFEKRLYTLLRVTPTNALHYTTLKTNLQNYNKILKSSTRLAKKHYYFSNLQKCEGDIKQSWSTINQLLCEKGKKTSIPDFFKIDGNIITGKKSIANNINNFIVNIGSKLER